MRLRSGLLVGESGRPQANQAVQVPTVTAMHEDDFSTRAEPGTPHPSSFSTNAGERSPGSPGIGEAGPSNYRNGQQPLRHFPHEENDGADFQLFPTPTSDVNQSNDEEMFHAQLPVPELRQPAATSHTRIASVDHEHPPHSSYFPEQNSHPTPVQPLYLSLQATSYQTPLGIPSGMVVDRNVHTGPWSPVAQASSTDRKRSFADENPTHNADTPDRNFPDKLETDLERLGKEPPVASEEEGREKKRRKRSAGRTSKPKSQQEERRDDEEDREHGQGNGQGMRVV